MEDTITSKWLSIIFNEEQLISSNRHWLEIKFWSFFAVIATLVNFASKHINTEFHFGSTFQEYKVCSSLVLFLTIFWILTLILTALYSPKPILRIKDMYSFRRTCYALSSSCIVISLLHLYIFFYTKRVGEVNYFLLYPLILLLLFSIGMIIPVSTSYNLESSTASILKKKLKKQAKWTEDSFSKVVMGIYFPICAVIALICTYNSLFSKYNLNFYSDTKLAILIFIIILLTVEAISIRITIDNLPDLKEFKFQVIKENYKDEDEIIDKYEEILLGKDALRWLKDRCLKEKQDSTSTIEIIAIVKRDIKKCLKERKVNNETFDSINTRVEMLRSIVKYKEEQLRGGHWKEDLNLTEREQLQYEKFFSKNISPIVTRIKYEIREVEVGFEALKKLKQ